MKNYKPYKFDDLKKLMMFFYRQGWYSHTLDLLTIVMQGGFEAFSGRATEGWEHRFFVQNSAIPELGIKSYKAEGKTLNDACRNLLNKLKPKEE